MSFLRAFFTYEPPELPPDISEEEPPDPNIDRSLSNPYRAARRYLIASSSVGLVWSTSQFALEELRFDLAGVSIDLKDAAIPFLLGVFILYLLYRWCFEFAMMPRHVRRWPLAQLDFRIVSIIGRFSLLSVSAGALDRSLWTIVRVIAGIGLLGILSIALTVLLVFITMPIRMRARDRANRSSVANAAIEGMVWAFVFAWMLSPLIIIGFGILSYHYEPLRTAIWPVPPDPVALGVFIVTLVAVFMSQAFQRYLTHLLFSERPAYRSERQADGSIAVMAVKKEKTPYL